MTQPDKLTSKQEACLRFLSDKMEATTDMVGQHLASGQDTAKYIGQAVIGHLNRKGLVMRLPELCAWRLTWEGREYVSKR